ncbi:GNAT domain-containing protein [Annulohypoxylon moriforme]|nr:GNAT domain-containing protein [Annulohypoxylon moriforme]
MRVNQEIAICGNSVILVPYEKHHVPTYHQWMEDEKIREATASERLTLEEEYKNQDSWRTSADKLTFIVCKGAPISGLQDELSTVIAGQVDVPDSMTGDVNAFIMPWDPYAYEDKVMMYENALSISYYAIEIDIMIAEPDRRGKGLGRAAVASMLLFIRKHLHDVLEEADGWSEDERGRPKKRLLKEVAAKIYEDNVASIALFKSLGFKQRGGVNYFGEVELVLDGFGEEGYSFKGSPVGDLLEMGYKEMKYDRSMLRNED